MAGDSDKKDQVVQLIHELQYCTELLDNLNQNLKDGLFTDVKLIVSGLEINCHKTVLSAASIYFKSMFTSRMRESTESSIELKDINPEAMLEVVEYAYTGSITVTHSNVQHLLDIANQYQFVHLKKSCEEFLASFMLPHVENCLDLYVLSHVYDLPIVKEKVIELLRRKFKEVVRQAKNEELKALSEDLLIQILKDNALDIEEEDIVFQLVSKWIHADKESRTNRVDHIISNVRLGFCSSRFLVCQITDDPLMSSETCQRYLKEAKGYHLQPDHQHEIFTCVTKPRDKYDQNRSLVMVSDCGITGDNTHRMHAIFTDVLDSTRGTLGLVATFSETFEMSLTKPRVNVIHDHVVITGGIKEEEVSDICMALGYLKAPVVGPPLLQARWAHATATVGDYLYIFGGSSACSGQCTAAILSTCEKIKVTKSSLGTVVLCHPVSFPDMPAAVMLHCAIVFGSKIYIVGGKSNASNGSKKVSKVIIVQEYDTVMETWSRNADLPRPCSFTSGVRYNDKIYVFGSTDGGQSCFQCYTPCSDTWTILTAPIHDHKAAPINVWKGRIILAGGNGLKEIEEYDPKSDTWQTWEKKLPGDVSRYDNLVNWKNF